MNLRIDFSLKEHILKAPFNTLIVFVNEKASDCLISLINEVRLAKRLIVGFFFICYVQLLFLKVGLQNCAL